MIRFEHFGKRFGTVTAVEGLSIEIGRGEIVALLGPNGSGKTTTLKAAAGLLTPTDGSVMIGDPARPATDPRGRRAISYLPQRVSFPESLTGREVVDFYARLRGTPLARTDVVLRFASLNGASNRPVGTYSGGMTQRLGLAVAALPESEVLLLDEPTAALDPDGLCAFYGLAVQIRKEKRTVVFTSHHLGDVEQLADRFGILVGGKLVALMTARELAERLGRRAVMRVVLDRAAQPLVQRVGERAIAIGNELRVEAAPEVRVAVLDAIRNAGAEIRSVVTEEVRLEALYRELLS
ncbi:MAG TPA: ABC transporter ATP-binding protein [Thermoanaerobaculia bacterium]|nr:ABC transporter ATP-binding protein [Thermoanaerobaculia bacterium]